jgi:uncharacterized membrane protein (DUF485 family)
VIDRESDRLITAWSASPVFAAIEHGLPQQTETRHDTGRTVTIWDNPIATRWEGETMNVNANLDSTQAIMANPRFRALAKARSTLGWTLTVIMLVIYYGFILAIAFDKGGLGTVVAGKVTSLGLVVGLGVLLSAFILVAIYVVVANTKFDAMTRALREELGQ